MAVLKLNDRGVKRVRTTLHRLFGDNRPIARGQFSAVFPGRSDKTVLKLMTDDVSYYMLTDSLCAVRHHHFPRVVENFGYVGEQTNRVGLYLVEMERLKKLDTWGSARFLANMLMSEVTSATTTARRQYGCHEAPLTLTELAKSPLLPMTVRNAIKELARFCFNFPQAHLDFHIGNFMQRSNGHFVLSDPLYQPGLL